VYRTGPGWGPVWGFCEQCNETSDPVTEDNFLVSCNSKVSRKTVCEVADSYCSYFISHYVGRSPLADVGWGTLIGHFCSHE
jgi:hypothetical protein